MAKICDTDVKRYFTNEPLFLHEELITRKNIESIRKYKNGNVNLIGKIFQDSKRDIDNKNNKWKVEVVCSECKKIRTELLSKTKLIEYIKNDEYKCKKCKDKQETKDKFTYNEELERREKLRVKKTMDFLDNYLDPNKSWVKEIKPSQRFYKLKDAYYGIYKEEAYSVIIGLDYSDFLKTPYWKAIALRIKLKSDFKCSLCGSKERLSTHHNTYENHGYELDHLEDLICICQDCHQIYHDNKELK